MKTVLVILTDGFEEIEALAPIDLLRRAGARVTLASCTDSLEVTGKCAVVMKAEVSLDDCLANDYDLLVLPGGPRLTETEVADSSTSPKIIGH